MAANAPKRSNCCHHQMLAQGVERLLHFVDFGRVRQVKQALHVLQFGAQQAGQVVGRFC